MLKPFQTRPATVGTKQSVGFCVICATKATTEALFQLKDCVVIQRYCDECLPDAHYDISVD
jgi:hypothetical protein